MKRFAINTFILFLIASCASHLNAQKIYKGQISVNPRELSQKGDSLYINIDVDFIGLAIEDDRSLSLVPLLINKEKEVELPQILINGRDRHKIYERQISLKKVDSDHIYSVIKADKKQERQLNYNLALPFEDWMVEARLDLKEDLCGCGGHVQQIAIDKLIPTVLMEGEARYDVKPLLSFVRPGVEEVKKRSEQREAFLDFKVAKAVIDPSYMNNPRELAKIESMLKDIREDKNLSVTSVAITGYASPEGSVAVNNKLSGKRAEALRSYLTDRDAFPASIYRVEQGGEDWTGLESLVMNYPLENKQEVMRVLNSGLSPDAREQALRSQIGGNTFQQLYNDIFPQLRRVLCRVDYTVRGFDAEEAKAIIKVRPQQLSLEEMFMVANTYNEEESGFAEVFETAVRMYPENEVANLNAAASALQWGDTARAKNYLDKAAPGTKEYINNLGVYYLLMGEYEKARELFNQAIKRGLTNGSHNLKELERKLEVEGL